MCLSCAPSEYLGTIIRSFGDTLLNLIWTWLWRCEIRSSAWGSNNAFYASHLEHEEDICKGIKIPQRRSDVKLDWSGMYGWLTMAVVGSHDKFNKHQTSIGVDLPRQLLARYFYFGARCLNRAWASWRFWGGWVAMEYLSVIQSPLCIPESVTEIVLFLIYRPVRYPNGDVGRVLWRVCNFRTNSKTRTVPL